MNLKLCKYALDHKLKPNNENPIWKCSWWLCGLLCTLDSLYKPSSKKWSNMMTKEVYKFGSNRIFYETLFYPMLCQLVKSIAQVVLWNFTTIPKSLNKLIHILKHWISIYVIHMQHPCTNTIFVRKDKSLQNTTNYYFSPNIGLPSCAMNGTLSSFFKLHGTFPF